MKRLVFVSAMVLVFCAACSVACAQAPARATETDFLSDVQQLTFDFERAGCVRCASSQACSASTRRNSARARRERQAPTADCALR